jgi:hypothetical protein
LANGPILWFANNPSGLNVTLRPGHNDGAATEFRYFHDRPFRHA